MAKPIVTPQSRSKLRVWDLPTRLFHWTLVVLVVIQVVSVEWGPGWNKEFNWLTLHFWCGYTILALLLFRIAWGFVGSTTARFGHFVKGPGAGIAYLRGMFATKAEPDIGHNPVGGWMVVALILGLLFQIVTGLFATDTDMGYFAGPLAKFASEGFSSGATKIHTYWINVLYLLVALHVSASLFYLVVKRQNLIGPMFSGDKLVPAGMAAPGLRFASARLALSLLVAAACIVYLIVRIGGG
jgi:cytochrome b